MNATIKAPSMDINGLCQHCNEKLLFPDNMTGDVVVCPHCGQQTQLVAHNPNLKKCPDCQQPVSVHAAACPHCGRRLMASSAVPPPPPPPAPAPLPSVSLKPIAPQLHPSLAQCKACGHPFAKDVSKCPSCGSARTTPQARGCAFLAGLLLLMFIVSQALDSTPSGGTVGGSPSAGYPPVNVFVTNHELVIENTSGSALTGLKAYLNGTPPFTYSAPVPAISAGGRVRVPLSSFAKKDGQRFKPADTKATDIWVGGGGYDYGSFRN